MTSDHIPTELPSAEIIAAVNIYTATPSAAPSQVDEVRRLKEALEIARHELRRQHEGVDFERRNRIRAIMPQIDQALASSSGG